MKEKGTIFLLGREDALAIAELEARCFPSAWSKDYYAGLLGSRCQITTESTGEELLLPLPVFGIFTVSGELAAYLVLKVIPAAAEAEVYNIAVLDVLRRQGMGQALLSTAIRLAAQQNMEKIFLEVRKSNMPAIALYFSLGFIVSGERKRYYPDGEDALLMEYGLDKVNK